MFGWTGKILIIDLSTKNFYVEKPAKNVYENFLGGRGMGGHYLREKAGLAWNDPLMPLLFFTGPLTDTTTPGSGFVNIMSKSPLTGTVGDVSAGGTLGPQIKRAGWDGIIITGHSEKLTGIAITNEKIKFIDASPYSGMKTTQLTEILKRKGAIASIGPAAENNVAFASIVVDGHSSAGRNGLGLSMAAKNLKYITVRGSGKSHVYKDEPIAKAREEITRLLSASPALMGEAGITTFGTGALYDLTHARKMMPTRNFQASFFAEAPRMNAWHYRQKYGFTKSGCPQCPVKCKLAANDKRLIPEFEAMSHFSALLGNSDIEAVVEANRMCNEYGMDPVSAAGTIACYAEMKNREIAPRKIIKLLKNIAMSKGAGAELKHGSKKYALENGKPELAMTIKGMELPAYDPRGACGTALGYAVSSRGACHLRSFAVSHEILRKPVATDRFSFSGKARIIKTAEDANAAADSLVICKLFLLAASLEEFAGAFHGATGLPSTAQSLLKAGERICYNERIINAVNGFSADDDDLPPRFFSEDGHPQTPRLNRKAFLKARANYYTARGLDKSGQPVKDKAANLGLK